VLAAACLAAASAPAAKPEAAAPPSPAVAVTSRPEGAMLSVVNVSGGGLLVMSVGPYPFNGIADFSTVELRREQDGVWRVTDNVTIDRVF
ncbi:MAG: hypothetical protein II807_01345, partial [Thermoguttaceae bacterium]|nr:hypothetical protein [Thermoguttaceae bacterium]